jgi:hypothetical protein
VWVGIEPYGDLWRVVRQDGYGGSRRVIHDQVDFNFALGIAEDLARTGLPRALRDRQADWRLRPPSDRQQAFFDRWGLKVPPTRGEAADVQSRTITRWSWQKGRQRT